MRSVLSEALEAEGFQVRRAASTQEALTMLEHERPHVVILDLMLPDGDGIELACRIRKSWSVSIMAMSASDAMIDRARESPSVDEVLSKPFEWETLVEGLQRLVA